MDKRQLSRVLRHAEALCRERGVRLTNQRKAVLRLLCESEKPLSAYELLDRMRDTVRNPTPPTVYRVLDFLVEQGLVHKLESLTPKKHNPFYLSCPDIIAVDPLSAFFKTPIDALTRLVRGPSGQYVRTRLL